MEIQAMQICQNFLPLSTSCISTFRELGPLFREQNRMGLADYVGKDGLHIMHSERGPAHVAEVLMQWVEIAVRSRSE